MVFILGQIHAAHAGSCDSLPWLDSLPKKQNKTKKPSLCFAQLPKTITPPKAARPRQQLESNSSSVFEVFMDINEPAFQKSSTCLAEASVWAGGKSVLEWKRFHEDLCCFTEDCVVYVWAPAGCHNTNRPATDAKRGDEKQVFFFFF